MNGIEPPTPMSTGSVPSQASRERGAGGVVRRAGGVDLGRLAGVQDAEGRARRPRARAARSGSRRQLGGVGRGVAGREPQRDPGAGGRDQGVGGAVDLGRVEADDRQRRLGPEPLDRGAGADPARRRGSRRTRRAAGPRGSRRRRPARCAGPRPRRCRASSWRVAISRRQRDQGVGHQAAPHARVDGVGEGADLDVGPDQAAQRGGEGGDADVPVAGVGDDDDVGARAGRGGRPGRARATSEPTSSSPSTKTVRCTGRSSPNTRAAPRWATIPALSSAAPRP